MDKAINLGNKARPTMADSAETSAALTLADDRIYNFGELESLEVNLPATTGLDFTCQVNFTSGATATEFETEDTVSFVGDDIDASGDFVPEAGKRYVLLFFSDGAGCRCVVQGVEM